VVLFRKWRPAEVKNEPGLRLTCVRCGRTRSVGTITPKQATAHTESQGFVGTRG
jgi:hypothetical protein